jgi:hypothetical protein
LRLFENELSHHTAVVGNQDAHGGVVSFLPLVFDGLKATGALGFHRLKPRVVEKRRFGVSEEQVAARPQDPDRVVQDFFFKRRSK